MDAPAPSSAVVRTRTISVFALLVMSLSLAVLGTVGCRSAPISGRRQLVLIPESQEIQMGVKAYAETLSTEPISDDAEIVAMVERVGRRIAAVADKPEYDWEFKVIGKDVQNAFALPGGKVAVYEGILPVCQSEAGLAVVMSHEIAHAIARHGGERMSQQSVVKGLGGVINAVSQRKTSEATSQKIMQVYGGASEYGVVLPFSRKHESEADAIGLILMAKAGYDPSVAPEFWERFSSASGSKPPEWLSTHPADARRATDLRALLPEAMKYYEAADVQIGMGDAIPLRQKPNVQLVRAEQPVESPKSTAAAALVGRLTAKKNVAAKKSVIEQAVFEERADDLDEEAIKPVAAEVEQDPIWNLDAARKANFKLPRKGTGQTTGPLSPDTDTIDPNGWEATTGRAQVD